MSSWHTYKLTKACGVTVTLDGQGADEQLGGYIRYLINHFSTVPLSTVFRELPLYIQIPDWLHIEYITTSHWKEVFVICSRPLWGEI